jgi:hypothetical protein
MVISRQDEIAPNHLWFFNGQLLQAPPPPAVDHPERPEAHGGWVYTLWEFCLTPDIEGFQTASVAPWTRARWQI